MSGFKWSADPKCRPFTDDTAAKFVADFGFALPASLERLLRVQNGGYLEDSMLITCSKELSRIEGEDAIIDLMSGYNSGLGFDMNDSRYMVDEWELPTGHVVLIENNHKFITIDPGDLSIHWTNASYDETYMIATDFDVFLNSLIVAPE